MDLHPLPTADSAGPAPRWADLLVGAYAPATWTLCLGVGTHALNWFLVATAVPSVVLDIGGASQVSWVSALYLVLSIVGSAIGGDLKKRFGGRATMAAAAVLMLAATAAAAAAPSFPWFLAARAVQGIAEGLILALCYILVSDVFPARAQPMAFSLLAVIWAVATIAAPLVAGVLTAVWSWRAAIGSLMPLAVGFLILALTVVPARPSAGERPTGVPAVRLALLLLGALLVCVASEADTLAAGLLTAASLAVFVAGLVLDRRADHPLLPRSLLAPRHAAPLGLWVIGLMMFAETGIAVFVSYVAQIGFGTSVVVAGQVASVTALAWSGSALLVARLGSRPAGIAIVAGPLSLATGLAVVSVATGAMLFVPLLVGLALCGLGFGVSHGFLNQRVMAFAHPDETETTSGGIPTFEGIGSAFGAAAAGLIAAQAGFDGSAGSVRALAAAFGFGAVFALLAAVLAMRFVALTRRH